MDGDDFGFSRAGGILARSSEEKHFDMGISNEILICNHKYIYFGDDFDL